MITEPRLARALEDFFTSTQRALPIGRAEHQAAQRRQRLVDAMLHCLRPAVAAFAEHLLANRDIFDFFSRLWVKVALSKGGDVRQRDLLAHRLQGYGTTVFAEMSALAASVQSINLGPGFPDVDGPSEIIETAVTALREGCGNQYPPGPGIPELRRAIAQHQHRFYDLTYDPEREVLVTTGATEAIAAALFAIIEPGDEVIMFEPYYDSYAACISMAGGVRRLVTLEPPDFRPSLATLERLINPRTRAILLNSPHNPTGMVLSSAELDAIAKLAVRNDLIVIADEVYEHLVYDAEHVPIATMRGMRDRTISISSAGKTFSLTGWKIGWVTGSADAVAAVRTAKQFLTYVSGGPFQYAIAHALSFSDKYFVRLRSELSRKRDFLCAGLTESGFEVYRPEGTYFVMTDIRSLGETDGIEFTKSLVSRCGVVAIPTVDFYDNSVAGATHVRFAFCKRDEILAAAVERLRLLNPSLSRARRTGGDLA